MYIFFEYKLIFIPGPNLIIYNYFIAPEIQHKSLGSKSSDLYSLGMLMVALFNGGQSLIQANYSTNLYFKQAGVVSYFIMMHIYFNINLMQCIFVIRIRVIEKLFDNKF